jgi:hypothetical protein
VYANIYVIGNGGNRTRERQKRSHPNQQHGNAHVRLPFGNGEKLPPLNPGVKAQMLSRGESRRRRKRFKLPK